MASSSHIHFFVPTSSLHRTSPRHSVPQNPASTAHKNFCPKNKKPTLCEWVETLCAVSNYRIAPRILDGWVPKSKPIRVGAAIHGRIVFRLFYGNNKYFMPPLLLADSSRSCTARHRFAEPSSPPLQSSIKQHSNAVARITSGIASLACAYGSLPILPAPDLL